ncbi:MAG: GNAT family N-acetyltransferase [Candidatus Natronoplasma sp.]
MDDVNNTGGKIVEYEPSMAKDVTEMFNKFKESWPGGFGGGIPFDEERVSDWFDESSSIADLIAVDEDGIPVGICELTPHWREKNAAYVGLLGVIQRAKGKKFGKRLLLRSIEKAIQESIERVELHTWSGNINAMPLYKKVGMFWVPDTSVYMQDYIPLLHQNELTKEWLDVHEDWYQHQQREIKQEPDEMTVQDMKIYRYRFEAEDDRMEVDIDRYGWGITGISRKIGDEEFTIKARVDSHEIFVGVENRYLIEIKNDTEKKKEIDIEVMSFEGLKFMEDFPSSILLDKGETKIISREFIVNNEAETYESSHKSSETINTFFKINGREFKLVTGGKIKPAVEVGTYRDFNCLFSGKEKEIYFDLKNSTEKALSGEIVFEVDGIKKRKEFTLDKKENTGTSLPIQLDFDDEEVEYIKLNPYIEREDGLFPMETYKHPLVNDVQGLLALAEKEDEVYLINNELKVEAELEGGKITVSEESRDSELPFELRQQVGPPFGKTRDSTLRYEYDLIEDGKGLHLVLHGESQHKPGVFIKKHIRIQKHSSEVEFWSELKNVSDKTIKTASETSTRKWGFDIEPYNSKAKLYTPLGDELIESDPVTDMLSGTLVPTEPEEWKETWTAYEDICDGAVSGLIWSDKNVKKIKLIGGLLNELKSVSKKLEPGESFESTRLWISAKKPSLNSFRRTWNRLVGNKDINQPERIYGKLRRKHITARLDDNILIVEGSNKRTVIIDKAVDYPMPGEYSIMSPEYMDCSFGNGKDRIEICKENDKEEIHLPLDIDVVEETTRSVDDITVHFSGERELDFQLPIIITKEGKVEVKEVELEGKKALHVDNGEIRFDVLDDLGGNLIRLKDSEGKTYFDDNFPEVEPKSYFENHVGGIEPKFMTPKTFGSFFDIEDVSSEEVTDGIWKGVKVDIKIEKLDALRGQEFSIRYLTLPGTKLIKIVLVHENPKEREVNWLVELFIDVLLKDSLENTIVECPGEYEVFKRRYQTQNFVPPVNIKKPWFYFKKEDVSIGGFAVEGSPVYSTVLCNDEINMAFLATNMVSEALGEEEIEMGILLDVSKDDIEKARRALGSK